MWAVCGSGWDFAPLRVRRLLTEGSLEQRRVCPIDNSHNDSARRHARAGLRGERRPEWRQPSAQLGVDEGVVEMAVLVGLRHAAPKPRTYS